MHLGGRGKVDGEISAMEGIIVNDKVVFKKGDVIAIIEMESTVRGESLEKLCNGAYADLRNHIKFDEYETRYGIIIGFSYDPVQALAGELDTLPLIKVYTKSELEG